MSQPPDVTGVPEEEGRVDTTGLEEFDEDDALEEEEVDEEEDPLEGEEEPEEGEDAEGRVLDIPDTIKEGARGDGVKRLQKSLNLYGYKLGVDGNFGPRTDKAVRRFQHVMGISEGIKMPRRAVEESVRTRCRLACACVLLVKETGGGRNVYGHDDVRCNGHLKGIPVTEANYRSYKDRREDCGAQGVGPLQLTFRGFQDQADEQGGCWKPRVNIRVGLGIFAGYMREDGMRTAYRKYNGSGPAAERYADHAMRLTPTWQRNIRV
ncbi:MAG: peptidoglycan-binding protein [Actinobacteria bacterium]|nr:peptidoglycan-binding protein [Actinomycetota bacterium]